MFKKTLGKTFLGQTELGPKKLKIMVQKNLGSKKYFGKKESRSEKF